MTVRYLAELLGIAAFAASGVLAAGRKRMDLIGVAAIAVVTALGGGTIRDVLLDRYPIAWIADRVYIWDCLAATAATLVWIRVRTPPRRALLVADALGLALFTIGGTQVAEQVGQGGLVAVIMGALTGAAGGVVRDILSNEIPLVFLPGRLYVTASLIGATLYIVLESAGLARPVASVIGMLAIAAVRFSAMRWDLRLPTPHVPDTGEYESSRDD